MLIPVDFAKHSSVIKGFREVEYYSESFMTEEEEISDFYKNSGLVW